MNQTKSEYIKNRFKRFTINLEPELFSQFREVCIANQTTPTTVIKEQMQAYIKKHKKKQS